MGGCGSGLGLAGLGGWVGSRFGLEAGVGSAAVADPRNPLPTLGGWGTGLDLRQVWSLQLWLIITGPLVGGRHSTHNMHPCCRAGRAEPVQPPAHHVRGCTH